MAVFSIYLFVKCLSIVFSCRVRSGGIFCSFLGSRGLSLGLVLLLICTPFLEQIREFVQRGDFTVWIVSANVAILLAAVLTVLSFDVDQILSHLWLIVTLLLGILLLDSVLLFFSSAQRAGAQENAYDRTVCAHCGGIDFPGQSQAARV